MTVITRFAPSPTGLLHIGNARTALFNWLYAKANKGQFLLRIEDTDKERSTQEAINVIISGLKWLGLDWDGDIIYQNSRATRHQEIAHQLVKNGNAYYCYCSKEELESMKAVAADKKAAFRYNGKWRDLDPSLAPKDVAPVVRIKAPLVGETIIKDKIQGKITIKNEQLDDMVLLRSDGTPTYMLAVVVDDHDMGVTDIIRGDDHLTNSFRQKVIYDAMGWSIPNFAHVSLIHGEDGAKLSKRHGALSIAEYQKMGYLPEALRNYLLRLGWSHGDDEIISTQDAIKWFDIAHIGKSPSRLDFKKLDNVNGHYMRKQDNETLIIEVRKILGNFNEKHLPWLEKSMDSLKQRAKNLNELASGAEFLVFGVQKYKLTDQAREALKEQDWQKSISILQNIELWDKTNIETKLKSFCDENNFKLGKIMSGIRAAITGSHISPSMFEIMEIIGKEESLSRLNNFKSLLD